eukprot:Blabericola_migrator_1__5415@NODE_2772_length_2370_cov_181_867564_g1736_i0_p3_GENE_NODE_2772_length_2370_cov_181_867564_g1736_i0NODE_2772_length_2370_cov_181_867564_g1736_i0_p3_ORF_typecomplete_len212_score25_92Calici_PP_N/PF08405_11/0_15_NODE_2772_length_2370_cov_181_867564_g1736_i08441479
MAFRNWIRKRLHKQPKPDPLGLAALALLQQDVKPETPPTPVVFSRELKEHISQYPSAAKFRQASVSRKRKLREIQSSPRPALDVAESNQECVSSISSSHKTDSGADVQERDTHDDTRQDYQTPQTVATTPSDIGNRYKASYEPGEEERLYAELDQILEEPPWYNKVCNTLISFCCYKPMPSAPSRVSQTSSDMSLLSFERFDHAADWLINL